MLSRRFRSGLPLDECWQDCCVSLPMADVTAVSRAMNPSVYQTASETATVLAHGSGLMMFLGFVAIVVEAIGKAAYVFNSRDVTE